AQTMSEEKFVGLPIVSSILKAKQHARRQVFPQSRPPLEQVAIGHNNTRRPTPAGQGGLPKGNAPAARIAYDYQARLHSATTTLRHSSSGSWASSATILHFTLFLSF